MLYSAQALTLDDQDNVVVAGVQQTYDGNGRVAALKYDWLGRRLWSSTYPQWIETPLVTDLVIGADDGIYVAAQNGDYYVIKFASDGSPEWDYPVPAENDTYSFGQLAALPTGGVYMGFSVGMEAVMRVIRLNDDGGLIWADRIATGFDDVENNNYFEQLALDPDGNLIVAGETEWTVLNSDDSSGRGNCCSY